MKRPKHFIVSLTLFSIAPLISMLNPDNRIFNQKNLDETLLWIVNPKNAYSQKLTSINDLLKLRANVNTVNDKEETCLLKAIDTHKNNSPVLKLLLEYGARASAKNASGSNALHIALNKNVFSNINTILNYSDSYIINEPDKNGDTPLHLACWLKYLNQRCHIIYRLLELGANVHTQNTDDETPAFLITTNQSEDPAINNYIIQLLIAHGASFIKKKLDETTDSPFEIAILENKSEIAHAILEDMLKRKNITDNNNKKRKRSKSV